MKYKFDTNIDTIEQELKELKEYLTDMSKTMTDEEADEFNPKFYGLLDESSAIAIQNGLNPEETRTYYKIRLYMEMLENSKFE